MRVSATTKNRTLFILFLLSALYSATMMGQNTQDYYVIAKSGYDLSPIQVTTNQDQTLSLDLADAGLETFFNSKPVYKFEKAFPTAQSPYLQRVYLVTLDNDSHFDDIFNRSEIEDVALTGEGELLYTPNDYSSLNGNPKNTALELINARKAWNVTQGNPNIIVGIVDNNFNPSHEDLIGQIVQNIDDSPTTQSHGNTVAGSVAAKTNNGIGLSGIGYNTNIIAQANGLTTNQVLLLSQVPGVKIINCSWKDPLTTGCNFIPMNAAVYEEIWNNGIIVIAAAGNTGTCGSPTNSAYVYPASYDHVISVTSVGHLYDIGTTPPDGFETYKDVHDYFNANNSSVGTHTHNDKVDISAPGYRVDVLNYDGYYTTSGTSIAAPIVAGVAALMLAVNPNLTPSEVRQILKDTADDVYHIPDNAPYIGLLGTGRVNAYRAVKTAACLLNPTQGYDVGMQDTLEDNYDEPNSNNPEVFWHSPDIWIRNQNDGKITQVHQNPEYDPNNPVYVYVRVTNNSCETVISYENNLKLYWSKANTALTWPEHWDGSLSINDPITGQSILMGDDVGTYTIPPLGPGESTILEFPWQIPNPADYQNINDNPWHFCLLARVDSPFDPMSFTETSNLRDNIKNNNNIALKNTTVVDFVLGSTTPQPIGAAVGVGNPLTTSATYSFKLFKEATEQGRAVYEEAEITLEMDSVFFNAWSQGGKISQNLDSTNVATKKMVTDNNALVDNVIFGPNEFATLYLSFNFLTDETTNKSKFTYHLVQYDANDSIVGGETYVINRPPKDVFNADAGSDTEIQRNDSTTLSADTIDEDATYNWYDSQGNLLHTGSDFTVSPYYTEVYQLEIVSNIDGYKDYDEVEVEVNPYSLGAMSPNPTTSSITINYIAGDANSAYIIVTNTQTGNTNNYILDVASTLITLDVSLYATGVHSVTLVCDGEAQDSKLFVKQ